VVVNIDCALNKTGGCACSPRATVLRYAPALDATSAVKNPRLVAPGKREWRLSQSQRDTTTYED